MKTIMWGVIRQGIYPRGLFKLRYEAELFKGSLGQGHKYKIIRYMMEAPNKTAFTIMKHEYKII